MVMGQGIGTLASVALAQHIPLAQVAPTELQCLLRKDGVYIEDVPSAGG
jgi:hypothetical protein